MVSKVIKDFIEPMEWTGSEGKSDLGVFYEYLVNGIPHIGVGHKIQQGEYFGEGLSNDEVYALYERDLKYWQDAVINRIGIGRWDSLSENKRAALVSFVYNTGRPDSDLFNFVISGNDEGLRNFWLNHYTTPGLTWRRQKEVDKYFESGFASGGLALGVVLIVAGLFLYLR